LTLIYSIGYHIPTKQIVQYGYVDDLTVLCRAKGRGGQVMKATRTQSMLLAKTPGTCVQCTACWDTIESMHAKACCDN